MPIFFAGKMKIFLTLSSASGVPMATAVVTLTFALVCVSVSALPQQTIIVPPEFVQLFHATRSPCPGSSQVSSMNNWLALM